MIGRLVLLAMALAPALPATAQISFQNTPKVQVAPVSTVTVRKGGTAPVEILFRVKPGYHINSNQPTSPDLIGTAVHFDVPTDINIGKTKYPQGKLQTFSFAPGQPLSVYTGDFAVHAVVNSLPSVTYGKYRVHAELKYQACDDRACYPPAKVPFAFDVRVAKAAQKKSPRKNPAQSPHVHG